jgi:HAD superfamily hydrolase (TIGR01549 family)
MTDSPLIALFRGCRALLLDFDGPVCSVFASYRPRAVTARLRSLMPDGGAGLPVDAGPHDALIHATRFPIDVVHRIEAELHDAEVDAVESATPTPGAAEVLKAARIPVAIVSNNTADAVSSYLARTDLGQFVHHVEGRDPDDPGRMKPAPYLIHRAARQLEVPLPDVVLVGDAETDVEAARAAGARCLGYANKPGKILRLTAAGADAVVSDLATITAILRTGPVTRR